MIHRCVLQPDTALAPDGRELPIDVFWFSLDEIRIESHSQSDALSTVVTVDEWRQLSRLRVDTVRRRRVAARAMLRCLLSRFLDVEPRRIVFERGEAGKPSVAWPSTRLQFNVSHSEGLAVVAVSQAASVGVDVEAVSEVLSPQTLMRLCRSLSVTEGFSASDDAAHSGQELLAAWVCEEACRKATGVGWSGVPIGGQVESDGVQNTWLYDETVVGRLSVPLPNHVAALALADRERTTLPDIRQWSVSAGDVTDGTLTVYAQRLADDSPADLSAAAVRSATYC